MSPDSSNNSFGPVYKPDWAEQHQFNQMFPGAQKINPEPMPTHVTLPDATIDKVNELARRVQASDKPKLEVATKYDSGKTDWSMLPWDAVEEIIKVLQFGAGKYNPWNWAENGGFKFNRLFNSSMRHLIAWFWRREDKDPESGIHHLAHLGCNVLFLLHYVLNGNKFKDNDNRRV